MLKVEKNFKIVKNITNIDKAVLQQLNIGHEWSSPL